MSLHTKLDAVQWVRTAAACTRFPRPFGIAGKETRTPPLCLHLNQVHGTQILSAPPTLQEPIPPGDGIYLWDRPGIIAVQTADCLPVLLASAHYPFAMAVHAGWRGLSQGILIHAMETATRYKIPPESLHAVIGPAIGAAMFEVGPEVLAAFARTDTPGLQWSHLKGVEDRWHLDLQQLAVFSLLQVGIPALQLSVVRSCTYLDATHWHSYRRDGVTDQKNWSWVSLDMNA